MTSTEKKLEIVSRLNSIQTEWLKCATVHELSFAIANQSNAILPHDLAIVYIMRNEKLDILNISGTDELDKDGPLCQSIQRFLGNLNNSDPAIISSHQTAALELIPDQVKKNGLLVKAENNQHVFGLLLLRQSEFSKIEENLAQMLCDYGQLVYDKIRSTCKPSGFLSIKLPGKIRKIYIAAIILLVMLIPIRESVNAPSSIEPRNPFVLRSPVSGVIEAIMVEDNEQVDKDQPILSFDRREYTSSYELAARELQKATTEYNRMSQLAISESQYQSDVRTLAAEIEIKKSELAFYQERLDYMTLTAPSAGIVSMADKSDLIGRPVQVGERILSISSRDNPIIEIMVAVSDAINMEVGTKVQMFLNSAPQTPISGEIYYASYRAEVTPEGYLAFKVKATIAPDEDLPRIGQRGTARIYGRSRPIILQILRRPFATLRQWSGV